MFLREYGCIAFEFIAPARIAEVDSKVMDKPELINKDRRREEWIRDMKPCYRSLLSFRGYRLLNTNKTQSPFRQL